MAEADTGPSRPRHRPDGVSDDAVRAVGRASEAHEYVIRARGHLYSLHQLIGRADFLFEEAAELLRQAGCAQDAEILGTEIVGRNVLDGRWTFQVVEEFDELYFRPIERELERLTDRHMAGRPHIYEAELKDERRTRGRTGHESRPPAAFFEFIETEGP